MLTAKQRGQIKNDLARRVLQARASLGAELIRRGILSASEKARVQRALAREDLARLAKEPRIEGRIFAAQLANADRLLASRVVIKGIISHEEALALDTMLRFQPAAPDGGKLDELIRTVEREVERGTHGNRR